MITVAFKSDSYLTFSTSLLRYVSNDHDLVLDMKQKGKFRADRDFKRNLFAYFYDVYPTWQYHNRQPTTI